MAYLLDANVFIQAKNFHYGFDFCPAFWDWLIEKNASRLVYSIEKVGDELRAGKDDLSTWADQLGSNFFLKPDPSVLLFFNQVSAWASSQQYDPAAVSTFLQVADFYLVADALAHHHTVVTHEIAAAGRTRIKIPSACIALNVRCITPFEMLRYEHAKFVLAPNP
ncbi:MAG: DUF4411 family protein [Thermodesulfovibrionales bacterium]|nr:DUF4411 family protein [Thermodesulfovibrionales bacterium]